MSAKETAVTEQFDTFTCVKQTSKIAVIRTTFYYRNKLIAF